MKQRSLTHYQVAQPLLLAVILAIGMFFGFKLAERSGRTAGDFSKRGSGTVQEVLDLVKYRYVDSVDLDSLEEFAISNILEQLDPHTYYIPPSSLAATNATLQGEFIGIGIEYLIVNDTLNVVYVMENGPSANAGLHTGDQIIRIGNDDLTGKNLESDQLSKLIRNKPGTVADLHILRNGKPLQVAVTRNLVSVPSVDIRQMPAPGIGYIHIARFTNRTYKEFMDAITGLQKEGMKGLILDLRGNPGGMMQEATYIADEFLEDGLLIVSTRGKSITNKETFATKPGVFEQGELVVIIDEFSASASEVLAGALQDNDRGVVIGERSFGKGLVQEQYDLSNGGALRLTVGRYYTPTGRSIQKPFGGSRVEYVHEIMLRNVPDSAWDGDSSKTYTTRKGKKLFGGGGITPDIVINPRQISPDLPLTLMPDADSIYKYSFLWYSEHVDEIRKFSHAADFLRNYEIPIGAWDASTFKFSQGDTSMKKLDSLQKRIVIHRVKANIARFNWRGDGFFEANRNLDSAFQKALFLIENPNPAK